MQQQPCPRLTHIFSCQWHPRQFGGNPAQHAGGSRNNAEGEPLPPASPATTWGWPAPSCAPEQPLPPPPGRDARGKFQPGTSRGADTQYPIFTPRPGFAGEAATCRWCRCSDPPSGGSAAPDRPQLLSGVLWPGQGLGPGGWHMKPNPTPTLLIPFLGSPSPMCFWLRPRQQSVARFGHDARALLCPLFEL